MLIDTHCHLADPAYAADRAEVLERAWAAGVARVVVIGESPRRRRARARAGRRPSPGSPRRPASIPTRRQAGTQTSAWLRERLRDPAGRRRRGDRASTTTTIIPRDRPARAFEAQLALAAEAGKPAVIHAREADEDVAAMLPSILRHGHPPLVQQRTGLLRAGLDLGHYVSFSGMVTFKNWRLDDAILETPLDRLLLETDGPYLAPVPHRGKRNEPAFVRQVAERIALGARHAGGGADRRDRARMPYASSDLYPTSAAEHRCT